jgi:hypothetical protein
MSASRYTQVQAHKETMTRPDYYLQIELPLPALMAAVTLMRLGLQFDKGATYVSQEGRRLAERTIAQIIERLEEQGLPYNAKVLREQSE